jgi:molybdate transport system substrate-binding protein
VTRSIRGSAATRTLIVILAIAILGVAAALMRRSSVVPRPVALRIAAAADLRFALEDILKVYRRERPTIAPEAVYGSSGTLCAQILNGAPFDIFMSADADYPRQLAAKGLTVAGSEFLYATGRLVVWVPAASALDVERAGLAVVTDRRVAHVALANPAHAPYGRAGEAAMQAAGVFESAKGKIVFGENVAQALQFVQSGAAEVGIVALSLALSPTAKASGRYWMIPPNLHPRLDQQGVILRTPAAEQARDFRQYLLADAARAVLQQDGFAISPEQ